MAIKTYPKGSGKKLSENFRAREFDCSCARCKQTLIDEKLVEYLQQIRDHFGAKVHVTGYRCPEHNAEVPNAAPKSKHTLGMAADISVKGVEPAEVAKFAESIGVKGIGLYDTFVHVDTRESKSFWFGHQQEKRTTFGGAPEETFQLTLPVLRRGMKGSDAVRALQAQLVGYGYPLTVTGNFGAKTENALMCYQEDNGLTPDGIAGPKTRARMNGVE